MTVAALTNYGMAHSNRASVSEERAKEYAVKAESFLRRAANLTPSDRSLWQQIAFLLLLQQREQEALVIWRDIPGSDAELLQRGHHARLQNKFAEAIHWYKLVTQLDAAHRDTWYFLGLAYSNMGRIEEALLYYNKALAISRSDSDLISSTELYCSLGWQYHWLLEPRDPVMALRYYDLALNSMLVESFSGLNECYFHRAELLLWYFNEPSRAILDYEEVLLNEPEKDSAAANHALALYLVGEDISSVETTLQELINAYPSSIWGYWRLGDVYAKAGRLDNAVEKYSQALAIAPHNKELQVIIEQLKQP
jgi:tetratricopeptide (TPR) repeat protein